MPCTACCGFASNQDDQTSCSIAPDALLPPCAQRCAQHVAEAVQLDDAQPEGLQAAGLPARQGRVRGVRAHGARCCRAIIATAHG